MGGAGLRTALVAVATGATLVAAGRAWAEPLESRFSAPDGAAGDRFGAATAASGATVVVGAPRHDHDGADAGAAYVFVRRGDFPLPQSELRASDAPAGAKFGSAVAVDGDTVAVGAPDAFGTGAVYDFERTRGAWAESARIVASDGAAGDAFGASVGVDGDTLVVGAPGKSGSSGAAYVLTRAGGTWTEHVRIGGETGSRTGASVAVSGGRLAVGAPLAASSRGAVLVYEGGGAAWSLAVRLAPADLGGGDEMGAAVAVSGGVVVAGARGADGGAADAGVVHVFERLGGEWRRSAVLVSGAPAVGDGFGAAVDVEGASIVVGAPGEDRGAQDAGGVHVFGFDADGWTPRDRSPDRDVVSGDLRGTAVAVSAGGYVSGAPGRASGMGAAFASVTAAKLLASPGEVNERFGDAVAVSGDTAIVGGTKDAAYVFVRTGGAWTLQATLEPGDPAERFGRSVALDGDTAVVGAPWDDDDGSRAGAAYVFVRDAGAWTQQAKLVPSDPMAGAWFGHAVAIDGDEVLVGSYFGDPWGAGHVFVRSGGAWAQQAKLPATDVVLSVAIDGDSALLGSYRAFVFARSGATWTAEATIENPVGSGTFGSPVALSGDTALVAWTGAEHDPPGAVHVYVRTGGAWTPQATLTPEDGVPGTAFGCAVAVDGDTAVVGAQWDGDRGPLAGAAFVYVRSSGAWRRHAKLTAPDGAMEDQFGHAVAVSGRTVLVGATDDEDLGTGTGSAWVFPVAVPVWDEGTALPVPGIEPGYFGLALAGDTALVGSAHDDAAGTDAGAVRVLVRSGNSWMQQAILTASDAAPGDQFGHAVALDGDTALIGARYAGAAYVFVRSAGGWNERATLTVPGITGAEELGFAVALDGGAALVCAPGARARDGAAYVFVRSGGAWTLEQEIVPDGGAWEGFGRAAALQGDTAFVGAPEDSERGRESGAAYVFIRGAAAWWQEAKLGAADARDGASFGFPIALSGDTALVGSAHLSSWVDDPGAAYVFSRASGSWTQDAEIVPTDGPTIAQRFGFAVALCGDTAVVGSIADDDLGTMSGSTYVFVRSAGSWLLQSKLLAPGGAHEDQFGLALAIAGDTLLAAARVGAPGPGTGPVYAFERSLRTGIAPTDPAPVLPFPADWTAGHAFAAQATAVGGTPPYQWRVVGGALPSGLALDVGSGRVEGAASETGAFAFTVECADALGSAATVDAALTIHPAPEIAPLGLAPAVVGRPFRCSLECSGGTGAFAWWLDDGGARLTLDPGAELISGTPTAAGTYRVEVGATDAVGAEALPCAEDLRVIDLLAVPRRRARVGASADGGPVERVLELVGGTRLTVSARVPRRATATAPVLELLDAAGAPVELGRSLRTRRGETRIRRFVVPATGRYVLRVTPRDTDPLAPVEVTVVLGPPGSAARTLDLAAGESNAFEFSTLPGAAARVTVAARRGERVVPEIVSVFDAVGIPLPYEATHTPRSFALRLRGLPGGKVGIILTTRNDTSGRVTATARIREPRGYDFALPDLPAGE